MAAGRRPAKTDNADCEVNRDPFVACDEIRHVTVAITRPGHRLVGSR